MKKLSFAAFGAGFWARYQLAAWREIGGNACVAVCDPVPLKAEALAREFGIPHWYQDPAEVFAKERLDFVDILASVEAHAPLTRLAASKRVAVICQKPMADSLHEAEAMVQACAEANVPLLVNENWRWQHPIREVKKVLDEGTIGEPFRGRIDMISGFPVFENQPFLREAKRFILADLGSHLLDVARFLFGEAASLYAQTQTIHPGIAGEDVATVMLEMTNGMTVLVQMAYAGNYVERERFPETFLFIEGKHGSLELGADFQLHVTTKSGTAIRHCPPPQYAWADPAYAVVHSSAVPCQADLLASLHGAKPAETTGADNLKTVRLVDACYRSARSRQAVRVA